MQPSGREIIRVVLLWAMGLILTAYVGGLLLHDHLPSVLVDSWLGLLTSWMPTAVCWLVAARLGHRRWDVLLATAAMTANAAGDTYYLWAQAVNGSVPFPSVGDGVYLLFYALMLAALVMSVQRHVRELASSVWWDCAVGSLGATSVLAVLLSPVLDSALVGPLSLATVVAVGYPMFDLLLVAAVVGIAALRDVRIGSRWVVLVAGLLVFSAADVVYGLQVTADTYVVGTPLDAGWAIALALIAVWVDGLGRPVGTATAATRAETGATAVLMSSLASVAALGVLFVGTRVPQSTLAVTLAGVTLLAAGARYLLAFRLLARMADLRRLSAATDELTGLPNRRTLYAEGRDRLLRAQPRRQALLMLDLDKFKEVNDSLGHHCGDELLVKVGARLREQLRPGDVLARLGGDEFAVLVDGGGYDEAVDVALRLRTAMDDPFEVEGLALRSSASIGIALFPDDGPDLSALLRKADIAMYKAKTSFKGHHVYSGADDAENASRLQTVQELRTALTRNQLILHYQPKVDLDTGQVHSVEALVRWNHPTRGLLLPDTFLNLVEESGLMPALTRVVLSLALDQVARWHTQDQPLIVAVNLSASSLVDSDLPRQVASMLAARGVSPQALQLEITEEFFMADRDRARSILTRLRHSGVQISIDDFGTGYSSLSYLRDLPIDELKLDRSFVLPMANDTRAAALVASTIGLAHSLGLRMVAEGVETKHTYNELAALGCDQGQGYYMSSPIPAAELDHWLASRNAAHQHTSVTRPRRAISRRG